LADRKQFEQTPFSPFNQPLKKWCRQASLPQREHFLPLSSANSAPHSAQVKGTMLSEQRLMSAFLIKAFSKATLLHPKWSGILPSFTAREMQQSRCDLNYHVT